MLRAEINSLHLMDIYAHNNHYNSLHAGQNFKILKTTNVFKKYVH